MARCNRDNGIVSGGSLVNGNVPIIIMMLIKYIPAVYESVRLTEQINYLEL